LLLSCQHTEKQTKCPQLFYKLKKIFARAGLIRSASAPLKSAAMVLPIFRWRAIVGGLTFSTVVTLLVLPTIYVLMDDLRNWARGIMRKASFVVSPSPPRSPKNKEAERGRRHCCELNRFLD